MIRPTLLTATGLLAVAMAAVDHPAGAQTGREELRGAISAPAPAARPTLAATAPRFIERPGEMEFTGRLLLRPKSAAERSAEGIDAVGIDRRDLMARNRIAPLVVEHAIGPDRYTIQIPAGHDENSFAAELLATGDYAWVQPDWLCQLVNTPNDPLFSSQWHHQMMESELGWDITVGSPEIICAFVDTGVDLTHEDLASRLVPGFNSVDDLAQVDGGDVSDVNGHGTRVGGCVGAAGNNGVGVAGSGWNLTLMPIRTSNVAGGGAAMGNILQGAEWAIENGARTASASYTGIQSPAIQDSGAYIRSLGGLLLYAANNNDEDHSGFDWPDVIVVGATDQNDDKAWFSSYGIGVDLFAPGVAILGPVNGGGYGAANGTSFATPIANGICGLIWSVNPDLTPEQVELVLYLSCDDKGPAGNDDYWGWGRANIRKAVELAAVAGSPQAPFANNDNATTVADSPLTIDILANDFDLNLDPIELVEVDATSLRGGTISVLEGAGPDGRDVVKYTPPAGEVGIDRFDYTISDGSETSTATVLLDILDPADFRAPDTPAATSPGAEVAYYALVAPEVLPDFSLLTPYAGDVVPEVGFESTNGDFATSGRADDVGAVFTGFIEVPQAAAYLLSVASDDGSRLWVGDTLIADNDGLHGMVEVGGEALLQAGRHAVRVEFFERGGGAGCIVRIEGGGLERQVVPASMWSYEIVPPCPADVDESGAVDFGDVLAVLAAWGPCPGEPCVEDVDGSGAVDFTDVLELLSAWGPCAG
jgi:hypothetical protein